MALLGKASIAPFSSTPGIPSPSGRGEPYLLKRPNVSCDSLSEDLYPGGIFIHKSQHRRECLLSEWLLPFSKLAVKQGRLKCPNGENKHRMLESSGDEGRFAGYNDTFTCLSSY